MKTVSGTNNRVLEIDLGKQDFREVRISDQDRKNYIGGKGLALKLLSERLPPGADPLGGDNVFIVTTGVLIGTGAPNSARFSAVSKSPLTGIISHSSCGGPFGNALKTSGWDGIILRGKADSPVVIVIDSEKASLRPAGEIMGKTTGETEEYLSRYGKGSLSIGPAGENRVRFANIRSGERFLGRGGLGAVLGSKNVKGMVAKGGEVKIEPSDPGKFKKYSKRGTEYIRRNPHTGYKYRTFGTLMHLDENNAHGLLPVRNFRESSSPDADRVSAGFVSDERIRGFRSCRNCSILCGHEGEFNGKMTGVPEYETVAMLGPNLGVFDIDRISEWNDLCGELGLDTISTGGTLAFIMEASETGIMRTPLRFGNAETIGSTILDIAHMNGQGGEFAMGSRTLSEKYGGKEFCMTVKGMEMSAYHPRGSAGMGLNYAVANRGGCHLSSAVFGLEVSLGLLDPASVKNKAFYVEMLENIIAGINSLHTCQFTVFPYILESLRLRYFPRFIVKIFLRYFPKLSEKFFDLGIYSGLFSGVTGIRFTGRDFLKAGRRIHLLERHLNVKEGITSEDDRLPERIMSGGGNGLFPLEKMKKEYYRIRKYGRRGIPPSPGT